MWWFIIVGAVVVLFVAAAIYAEFGTVTKKAAVDRTTDSATNYRILQVISNGIRNRSNGGP